MRGKRYSFVDPLLRLYVRLYGKPVPPSDDDVLREVDGYAKARLPQTPPAPPTAAPIARPTETAATEVAARSGIIEID
jgi:hypothetical protein